MVICSSFLIEFLSTSFLHFSHFHFVNSEVPFWWNAWFYDWSIAVPVHVIPVVPQRWWTDWIAPVTEPIFPNLIDSVGQFLPTVWISRQHNVIPSVADAWVKSIHPSIGKSVFDVCIPAVVPFYVISPFVVIPLVIGDPLVLLLQPVVLWIINFRWFGFWRKDVDWLWCSCGWITSGTTAAIWAWTTVVDAFAWLTWEPGMTWKYLVSSRGFEKFCRLGIQISSGQSSAIKWLAISSW